MMFGLFTPVFFIPFTYGGPWLFWTAFVAMACGVLYAMTAMSLPHGMVFGASMMVTAIASLDVWVGVLAFAALAVSLGSYALSDEDRLEPEEQEDVGDSGPPAGG